MKISTKLALAAAIVLSCSPVVSNAEPIASTNSSADPSINAAKLPNENLGDKPVRSQDSVHSPKKPGSKKGILGIFSLLFVSII